MSRLPDEFLACVVFLGYQTSGGPILQVGTAFFIGRALAAPNHYALYTVTALHVIDGIRSKSADGFVHVRVNRHGGGPVSFQLHVDDWIIDEDGTYLDLALVEWAPPSDQCSYKFVPDSLFVSDEAVRSRMIGVGDDLYITGLLVNHAGKDRNVPIVRSGIIASMPLEPVTVQTPGKILTPMEAYLVEARSIGGLSGSPVFVSIGGLRHPHPTSIAIGGQELFFLGVMRGHWDARFDPSDAVLPDQLQHEVVNMGIGIVVPAPSVLKLTDRPEFVATRRELSQRASSSTPWMGGQWHLRGRRYRSELKVHPIFRLSRTSSQPSGSCSQCALSYRQVSKCHLITSNVLHAISRWRARRSHHSIAVCGMLSRCLTR